ncbi:PAS domain S-box protein [Cyanobacterium sp. Dongsha4]|uniref:PAS domain S-box protein n=1 Tax=Cyanobacterium sp. DS4 TaxID=2878255 RepID=UPI002E80A1BF|nr:PAS domain S-box protein [Cyanobacterium sp. Dongsha4]WVK99465.1 PAS domain S-box protein [Cyanobacterium sp. Dongsha4]
MEQKYKVITKDTFQEWQRIIDAITNIAGVTVGLITRVLGNQIKTIVTSQNAENPYVKFSRDSVIGSGIYCEQVIRNKKRLIINNALTKQNRENNFDLQCNLISYLGFPLRYSDNRIFGTICLLNNRETCYSDDLIYLLEKMRDVIESQIHEIENNWLDQLFVNKSLLKTIFDTIPVGIGLSAFPPNSAVFYVNPQFINLFGYITNDIPTINDWFNIAYPDPHYRSLSYKLWFKMILQARQKKGIVEPQEFHITCKNGDVKDVLISVKILDNMILSSFVDITKQKRTEAQLRLSEKRHRLLAEYATDNIWTMTPDFQFDYISPSIEYIRGYTPEEVRLQTFEQILVAPDSLFKGYQRLKEVSQCSPENAPKYGFRDELELLCKDGSSVWTEVIITPVFDEQGNLKQIQGITRNITERKQKEEELKQLQQEYLKIVDNAPIAIASYNSNKEDPEITFLNKRFHDIFGYTLTDMPTMSEWAQLAYPDANYRTKVLSQWHDLVEKQRKTGKRESLQCKVVNKYGEQLEILFSATALENQVLVSMLDLTDLKQVESELEKARQTLAQTALAITEAIPVGTYTMVKKPDSPMAYFSFMSERFLELTGLKRKEAEEDPLKGFACVHPDDYDAWVALNAEVFAKKTPFFGETRVVINGEVRWITAESVPRDLPDGSTVWEGVLTDITDRKNYEFELKKAHDQIIQINAELEERVKERTFELEEREIRLEKTNQELIKANRLKDEFLAMMSHELRTPLNAILGMTEILQEKIYGEINIQQEQSLKTIENSGQHLLSLINDILDVTKIEAGKIDLNLKNISVYSLCESSLDLIQAQAQKNQIQLQSILPPDLPEIYADENRIRQVLLNLLNNAVKFTPNYGQVTLEAIYPPLSDNQDSHHLRLLVTDTGIGIAKENINKLFQPFVQIDSNLNRQYEGTGLGLVLVKKFVELHGGKVSVSSRLGWGSCFLIDLPIARNQVKHKISTSINTNINTSNTSNSRIETKINKKQPLILLAEDNEANVISMQNYLEAKGYRLFVAMDGQEAISALSGEKPDLIVMDIQMPKLDGIRAIEYLKQNSDYRNIPIIALTALVSENDREKCLKAGADEYMSKPVRLRDLANHIQRLLTPLS